VSMMESFQDRLARFQHGPPTEVISTLTNSINNIFNPEIASAAKTGCWSLMFMGTHAVALTVSQGLFGLTGKRGYVRFLQVFVDEGDQKSDFSAIGSEIHEWRNVLAHQWLSGAGHAFGLDPSLESNWQRRDDVLVINPVRYHEAYSQAFRASSNLWRPDTILSSVELEEAKVRLIDKYVSAR
jgi:hypothetical protein